MGQIVERLAHAHEDDVGQPAVFLRARPLLQIVPGHLHLGDDLGRRQVAHQGLGAGVAEGAVQRAAHLTGDAKGARAAHIGDVDGLDLDARRHADQPLAGAIAADLTLDHLGAGEREGLGQGRAGLLGHVGHGGEVGQAIVVNPPPQLGGPHLGLFRTHHAGLDQGGGQLRPGQARQVRPGRRGGRRRARKIEGDAQGSELTVWKVIQYRRGRARFQLARDDAGEGVACGRPQTNVRLRPSAAVGAGLASAPTGKSDLGERHEGCAEQGDRRS